MESGFIFFRKLNLKKKNRQYVQNSFFPTFFAFTKITIIGIATPIIGGEILEKKIYVCINTIH